MLAPFLSETPSDLLQYIIIYLTNIITFSNRHRVVFYPNANPRHRPGISHRWERKEPVQSDWLFSPGYTQEFFYRLASKKMVAESRLELLTFWLWPDELTSALPCYVLADVPRGAQTWYRLMHHINQQ